MPPERLEQSVQNECPDSFFRLVRDLRPADRVGIGTKPDLAFSFFEDHMANGAATTWDFVNAEEDFPFRIEANQAIRTWIRFEVPETALVIRGHRIWPGSCSAWPCPFFHLAVLRIEPPQEAPRVVHIPDHVVGRHC